jgi:hypothetical protein
VGNTARVQLGPKRGQDIDGGLTAKHGWNLVRSGLKFSHAGIEGQEISQRLDLPCFLASRRVTAL